MLNRTCLQGRLTKDVEIRNTSNQTAVASFTIACDRAFKNGQGETETDFINCVAWRQTATFLSRYFRKGDMVLLSGKLQTRSYDDRNGNKVFVTEVVVDEVNFCGSQAKREENRDTAPTDYDEDDPVPFDI